MPRMAPLSAAESQLLLDQKYSSPWTLKLTFLELMARGMVCFRPCEDGQGYCLRVLALPAADAPPHVASLMATLRARQSRDAPLDEVTTLLRNKYGNLVKSFKDDLVLPSLVARGLLEEERFGLFWLGTRLRLTAAGEAERQRIEKELQEAREIPQLLSTNPAHAAAIAVRAGGSILLVDRLSFHYAELDAAIRAHHVDSAGNLVRIRPAPGRLDLTTCHLGSMDRGAVALVEDCLATFEDTIRLYGIGVGR